jgi:hypothetical protein
MSTVQQLTFGEILDAVEKLGVDEQDELAAIVRKRIIEQRRKQILVDVEDARKEIASGGGRAATVEEIMRELQS